MNDSQKRHLFYGGTDKGRVREQNEDSILYCQFAHSEVSLLVVADGVGGHAGGEVASQLCIQQMHDVVEKAVLQANSGGGYGSQWLSKTLGQAINDANRAIVKLQQQEPELEQMATTVVSLLIRENEAALSHLGDSRGYVYAEQQLTQMTEDHTMLQDMLNEGRIDRQAFELSPMHHVISQALGVNEQPELEIQNFLLQSHARYLLCSDGLTDCVSDAQIQHILEQCTDPAECIDDLIVQANDNGGSDNISAVLLFVDE